MRLRSRRAPYLSAIRLKAGLRHSAVQGVRGLVTSDRQAHGLTADLRWVFAGEGRRLGEVESFRRSHPGLRLEMLPYVQTADLRAHLCSGDVHLVSLKAEWAGVMAPSKLQAAFAVGRPVLFVGPLASDPARWVRESGGGWVADEDDPAGLVRMVRESCDPVERGRRGLAAHRFAFQRFGVANCDLLVDSIEGETT